MAVIKAVMMRLRMGSCETDDEGDMASDDGGETDDEGDMARDDGG